MALIIETAIILHNWFIDLQGDEAIVELNDDHDDDEDTDVRWMHIGRDNQLVSQFNLVEPDDAIKFRDNIKSYLWNVVSK